MINKKAISVMVSYTLLVIIAIALSVIVYGYLKLYVPSAQEECPADIALALEFSECNLATQKLNVTLSNRGLFNVSGAYVRVGMASRTVRSQVNEGEEFFSQPFSPGSQFLALQFDLTNNLPIIAGDTNVLELQPFLLVNNRIVPCEEAIVNYPLTCS